MVGDFHPDQFLVRFTDEAAAESYLAGTKVGDQLGFGFYEVYVDADLETCETRDPKGLYAKARRGEIPEFTGISAPYEPPEVPELVINTAANDVDACVDELVEYVERHFALGSRTKS